jgi:hypothetical protein
MIAQLRGTLNAGKFIEISVDCLGIEIEIEIPRVKRLD